MQDDIQVDFVANDQVIDLITKVDQPTLLIIDFDETLLLRNSTAEYINSLRPRWFGFLLIKLLKIMRPWVWLPRPFRGEQIRDWFLVVVPTILLPWTLWRWRRQGLIIAQEYSNQEITAAVAKSDSPVIIASLGFKFIIEPILKHISIKNRTLIGCRFWQGAGDRAQGKLAMLRSELSTPELTSAIVITDSHDDLPLLQVVAHPCLTLWSEAKYVDPFSDLWLYSLLKGLRPSHKP